ncbi:thiamine-monophosphate kinase : Thiamine-monophosphate kinase OS=Planctomyces maris DSM 8797 GN=thiL PE=3 SV=1: AIRS: AIRS_C [Gemmata massiliana]|uniref:Thiamine-monophosphate kinase n=1 Tax=Gemmata massiliana TaxID=1210884 RepID=A0A6P2D077_9BACT|nr:thiamine-phosphate kinase [Gemmata massiliana]VTR93464.1 thiamine-monophosphate kinase : Thiamine-monophosphate kinase OS=Planctomyces maris DSM 8797 GN=thiL PE=3 SV=1: AIRS: AIRS_C [Gemmata massiliana]
MPNEFEYIAWLRSQTPADARVRIGPGDDCAALAPPARELLVTTDMLMDGTDFILSEVDPRRVGRKAMAVNLSDIAAMAGIPIAAVVSVALPRPTPPSPLPEGKGEQAREITELEATSADSSFSPFPSGRGDGGVGSSDGPFSSGGVSLPKQLYLGLRDIADAFGVPIVGGDTNTWTNKLVISVTALGEATARGPVRRSGAKPGDWLFVTGPLGGSILGHHLDFTPRVREALLLHEAVELRAMLDISDGLAADLNHICEESKCGAVVVAEAIPISDAARELSRTSGKTPLQHALGDGEDFELVFAVSPTDGTKLLHQPPVPGLAKIGECIEAGLWIEENGERKSLAPTGWVHAL